MSSLLESLRARLGPAGLLTAPEALAPYLEESRGRFRGEALAAARPASTADVAAVLAACHAHGVGVVPQGGNTGRCGGALPAAGQIVLSLERMDCIRTVDTVNFTLSAEAGCILAEVQAAARAAGRLFPLSLGAEGSCRIGGNLATNAGGTNVLRYGNARELCLGLEVVLADGRVWDGLRGLRKDNTGYDLRDLFIGSEGTLGVITAAVLKLFPLPRAHAVALVALQDPARALALLARARETSGDTLTSFELMPRIALGAACAHVPGCRMPFDMPPWTVLLELAGGDPGLPDVLERLLAEAWAAGEILDAAFARSEAQAADFRRLREAVVEAQKHLGASLKHDVAVPVSRVPEFIREAARACEAQIPGVRVYAFGHVGDGNVHFNLSQPDGMARDAFLAQAEAAARTVHGLAVGLGGSFSAEHGIGCLKTAEMARFKTPLELELMRTLKAALDPKGILNPGKVLPPR